MDLLNFDSYKDFCKKTGLHGRAAIETLLYELKKLEEEK